MFEVVWPSVHSIFTTLGFIHITFHIYSTNNYLTKKRGSADRSGDQSPGYHSLGTVSENSGTGNELTLTTAKILYQLSFH